MRGKGKVKTTLHDDHVIMQKDNHVIIQNGEDHDQIEVLSSQTICVEATPVHVRLSTEDKLKECEARKEKERKRVSRVVAVISVILLGFCIVLISISFMLSGDIDEIGELSFTK